MTEIILYYLAYILLIGAAAAYLLTLRQPNDKLDRAAPLLSAAAIALLLIGAGIRTARAQHLPFATNYEFSMLFLAAIVALYLILRYLARDTADAARAAGAFVLPITCTIGFYPLFIMDSAARAVNYLPPALRSIWFPLHVVAALGAYGAFAVAAGGGGLYLFKHRRRDLEDDALPPLGEIEDFIWRAVAVGFPLMSLALLTGAVWAQAAWGSYWSWDPKETWALIVWLIYVIYFHARVAHGWGGRRTALIVIIGFGTVLFTLWGVPGLVRWAQLESLHVF